MGGLVSGIGGKIIGGALGSAIAGSGRKKASQIAGGIVPKKIDTGFSTFDTRKGKANIDPTIRAGQETFLSNVRGLRDPTNAAFDEFHEGIGGLRDEVSGLRADFEGNESAFREATLNPVRESIARGRGDLTRNLARTGVRGSFADQAKSNFELSAGRTLSDAEANVENQRINNLGDLLGMDADLLKAGLLSEQGRTQMSLNLEQSLANVSSERFSQEMAVLGLPAQFIQGNIAGAGIKSNAEGIFRDANTRLGGDIIERLGDFEGGSLGGDIGSRDRGLGAASGA